MDTVIILGLALVSALLVTLGISLTRRAVASLDGRNRTAARRARQSTVLQCRRGRRAEDGPNVLVLYTLAGRVPVLGDVGPQQYTVLAPMVGYDDVPPSEDRTFRRRADVAFIEYEHN